MSRFNKPTTVVGRIEEFGVSANGNVQAVKPAEQEFYEHLVSFLVGKDGFYSSSDEKQARMEQLIDQLTAAGKYDFIANSLVFARTKMDVRNAPILGLVAFADALRKQGRNYPKVRSLTNDVIRRVDQITDVLALTLTRLGGKSKLPMSIKRGLGDAFNKFNEYAFAKYNRAGQVTLKDALRILHPTPKSEKQGDAFRKIMEGTLSTPDTWEVALSANGQKAEEEKATTADVWHGLIDRDSLGYQAILKNLRNMLKSGISVAHQQKVAQRMVDDVKKGKALPFEFLAAYEAIEDLPDQVFKKALRDCMDASTCNLPKLGDVWAILDVSGSMRMGKCDAWKNASFLVACLAQGVKNTGNKFALTVFAGSAETISFDVHAGVYNNYKSLTSKFTGGSTNFASALAKKPTIGFKPDSVFVLTDGEVDSFGGRQRGFYYGDTPDPAVVTAAQAGTKTALVINMESRPTTPLPEVLGWKVLAGWSPKLFDYVNMLAGGTSIIKELSKPYPAPILK